MKSDNVIRLLNQQRKHYEDQQKFHYFTFVAFILILLLDFIVIVYTKLQTLNAYAWAVIIFLFVLIAIEVKQYYNFKLLKDNVDDFYLSGEYGKQKES